MTTPCADLVLLSNVGSRTPNSDPLDDATALAATAAVSRILQSLLRDGTPSDGGALLNAARSTLSALAQCPCLVAVPSLLSIVETGICIHGVDVFVLCSAAWKAIVSASIQSPSDLTSVDRARVIAAAVRSAFSMLSQVAQEPVGQQALRHTRIARFHSVNAARCAKAFAGVPGGVSVLLQSDINLMKEMCNVFGASVMLSSGADVPRETAIAVKENVKRPLSVLFRYVAWMLTRDDGEGGIKGLRDLMFGVGVAESTPAQILAMRQPGRQQQILPSTLAMVMEQQQQNMQPLLGSAGARRLLSFSYLCGIAMGGARESPNEGSASISTAEGNEFMASQNVQNGPVQSGSGDAANSGENGTAQPPQDQVLDSVVLLCQRSLRPLLLPLTFEMLSILHADLAIDKLKIGNMSLVDLTAKLVIRCSTYLDVLNFMHGIPCTHDDNVVAWLLNILNYSGPTPGMIAEACVLEIVRNRCSSGVFVHDIANLMLGSFRLALAVNSSYVDSRWVPLLCKVFKCLRFYRVPLDNIALLYPKPIPGNPGEFTRIVDPAAFRIIASLCQHEMRISATSADSSERLAKIFEYIHQNPDMLRFSVEQALAMEPRGGRLASSAVQLAPFVCSEAFLATIPSDLKSTPSTNTKHMIASVNAFDPRSMAESGIRSFAKDAIHYARVHGPPLFPGLAAFVSRCAPLLLERVSLATWQDLAYLMEDVVRQSTHYALIRPPYGGKKAGVRNHVVLHAAVMYHAACTLVELEKILTSGRSRSLQATLPFSILKSVRETSVRLKEAGNPTSGVRSPHDLAKLGIRLEIEAITQREDIIGNPISAYAQEFKDRIFGVRKKESPEIASGFPAVQCAVAELCQSAGQLAQNPQMRNSLLSEIDALNTTLTSLRNVAEGPSSKSLSSKNDIRVDAETNADTETGGEC